MEELKFKATAKIYTKSHRTKFNQDAFKSYAEGSRKPKEQQPLEGRQQQFMHEVWPFYNLSQVNETQQCNGAALKKKKKRHGTILDCTPYGPDPGIIAGPPSGMLEMERTLRDQIVQLVHFTDKESKTLVCPLTNKKFKCSSQVYK